MAISKILYIKDCGKGFAGKHLKQALEYIAEREKTGDGRWISSLNCQAEHAYDQMRQTKMQFGKTNQRQGYHLIISFTEGEVDAETAFEVIGKFAKEYLGQEYEALYAVHDNTEHIHGHIVFNSVSFRTGKKYRYEKGDWARKIQPITNRLCEEYGLSTIEIAEDRAKPTENYKEWNDFREGKFVWSDMIKRDIDACIIRAATYESFLAMLSDLGYEIKNAYRDEGKYIALRAMGLTRFRRMKSLGENYSEERIRERIVEEDLSHYRGAGKESAPKIVTCRTQRFKKAKLSGIQKKYFARLYRTGLLKKRPYSQAWKYRDDIRKMQKMQEDYLFLSQHQISNVAQLKTVIENLADKKKETSKEKSRIFKERARVKPLFDLALEKGELQILENSYQRGELLFQKEHERYELISEKLAKDGYSSEQIAELKEYYQNRIAWIREQEKSVLKTDRIARRILAELKQGSKNIKREKEAEKVQEINKRRENSRRPLR